MEKILGRRTRGRRGRLYTVFAEVGEGTRYLLKDFDVLKAAICYASHVRRGNIPGATKEIGSVVFEVVVERRNGEVLYRKRSIAERYIRRRYDMVE